MNEGQRASGSTAAGHPVRVRDKALMTPRGTPMAVPTAPLAAAIAAEWPDLPRGGKPDPRRLKLTRVAATALDLVRPQRTKVIDDLIAYAETELVCHRASAPPGLVARQDTLWQPLLDWVIARYDASLQVTRSVLAVEQPPATLARLRAAIEQLDEFRLAALSLAVTSAGSLVIGLALIAGRIDAAVAFEAAELDATYQIEQWGEDAEATARRTEVRDDLETAARFVGLLAPG